MKKLIFILLIAVFSATGAFAQAPGKFNYQAVIRNSSGAALPNTAVDIQFSIYDALIGGSLVYQETVDNASTNTYGVVNLQIGVSPQQGTLGGIAWGNGTYWVNIGMRDGNSTGSYTDIASVRTQLVSVPYSLYSETSGAQTLSSNGDTLYSSNGIDSNGVYIPGLSDTCLWNQYGNDIYINNLAGNVGIGTTSPQASLHVNNSGNHAFYVGVDNNLANTTAQIKTSLATIALDSNSGAIVGAVAHDYFNENSSLLSSWRGTYLQYYGTNATNFNPYYGLASEANTGGLIFQNLSAGFIGTNGPTPIYISPYGNISTTFLSNGYVGIGTTNPAVLLDLKGNNVSYGGQLRLSATDYDQITFYNSNNLVLNVANRLGDIHYDVANSQLNIENLAGNKYITLNQGGGNIGIGVALPQATLDVAGNIHTAGITETSDERFKTGISTISNAIGKLMQLTGREYFWKTTEFPEHNFTEGKQIGVIAQEVEKVLPDLVHTDNSGYKSVEYTKLIPVLIEAFKEQQREIEKLEKQVEELSK